MDPEFGQAYRRLHETHFWFRARARIIGGELARLRLPRPARILDVGCGDGLYFPLLEPFGEVLGIETDRSLVASDNPRRERIRSESLADPYWNGRQFDLVTALDVIEHIEDDRAALARIADLLPAGGLVLLTVPAFPALWDRHDEINHHYRRYTKSSLLRALPASLQLISQRYLFPSLFAPKWIVARLNRRNARIVQHRAPPAWLNRLGEAWLVGEDRLFRSLGAPVGSSLLAVLRKRGGHR
jgi:SAM-dependent methyltransferase